MFVGVCGWEGSGEERMCVWCRFGIVLMSDCCVRQTLSGGESGWSGTSVQR